MLVEQVKYFITQNPQLTALYLILGKIIGAILFFPGIPLTLLAGATLGVFWGTIVSMIGNTIGATLAFLIARYFLKDYVTEKIYKKYPKIDKYESRFFKKGFATVIVLRLIPLFPFNALNYILGITRVSTRDYIIGTFFGIMPGTLAFVYFGASLRMLSPLGIVLSILAILSLTYFGKLYEKKYA